MFNIKALLLLLLSVGFGGGASMYAKNWLEGQQGTTELEEIDSVNVVVAAREIPYGQPIEATHLRTVAWPADSVPDGTFTDTEALLGMLVNQTALPGELILQARVVEKLAGSRLSALIAPNMRAITIRVNDVNGVAGFLLPGNRVDVLATRVINQRAQTRTLLQDIKVLAIDQKANPDKDDPIVVRAVTLEADLKQAEKLSGATSEGKIQLVLRNPDDRYLQIDEQPVAKSKPRVQKKDDNTTNITIIRGTAVGNAKVKI